MREFKIPGKVQAKQRPRFANGRTYTPKPTVDYERFVKSCYQDYIDIYKWEPLKCSIRAEIEVFMKVPKSDSKLVKKRKLEGYIRPMVTPDTDNLAKSLLDALNGLAYGDDKQIVELEVKKFYGETEEAKIKLIPLEEM
ncbi:MAG: RusA family crossover junction endodeoxyribonuclease [Turicibacter sp.]|nr:RusA family crossover junction endodeoxyribonuclease [Turicibacter sp.]